MLWDARTDLPILGGWAAAIAARSAERARAAVLATKRGESEWLEAKLLGSSSAGEWQRRALAGKLGPSERARSGAQAGTLWGRARATLPVDHRATGHSAGRHCHPRADLYVVLQRVRGPVASAHSGV